MKRIIAFDFDDTLEKYHVLVQLAYLLRIERLIPYSIRHRLNENAEKVIKDLSQNHSIMIISKTQILPRKVKLSRIKESPFNEYLKDVIVVTEKNVDIYKEIMKTLKKAFEGKPIMIGNDYLEDYQFPKEAGFKTILYDPNNKYQKTDDRVSDLDQIRNYL